MKAIWSRSDLRERNPASLTEGRGSGRSTRVCWVGAAPSSLLKGISLLEKGDQRLRGGTAELKHLVIPGDDLQGPALPAKPKLSPVSEGNVDYLDAFNFSDGDLFIRYF